MKPVFLQQLVDFFFPQVRCLSCDEPRRIRPGNPLCVDCFASLDDLLVSDSACGRCKSPMKRGQACTFCADGGLEGITRGFAPYAYHGVVQQMIVKLKFLPCVTPAPLLAKAMAGCITGLSADALVPVPLSREHKRERGMNQSLELARLVSGISGLPVLEALTKPVNTKRQSGLPAAQRKSNVQGAYRCTGQLAGLRLILVDDVRTTGSTASACAAELKKAGAQVVYLLTAAVASARREADQPDGGAHAS